MAMVVFAYIPEARRLGFDDWSVLECTHNYNKSLYYKNNSREVKTWEGYDAFAQTETALDYLEKREKDKPFILMLAYGIPHNPYQTAPPAYKKNL